MDIQMKQTRLRYDITYTEVATEAGLQPGAVYAVELERPLFAEDKPKVQAALKRLVERKKQGVAEQKTVHMNTLLRLRQF